MGRMLAGRYRVVGLLGRGGMGSVYRAVDEVLGREVAVKELRTFSDASAEELAELSGRMQREARAAARIRHPGVIAVHDVVEQDGRPLIVMEWIDGRSLDDVLRERGALEPREAASIGAKVAEALAAAHDAGVLHRDVKPGNVLLARDGRVVLTDFGIATLQEPGEQPQLTTNGQLVGSLDLLSPERAQGHVPGPASDVWSLGAMLYAAVEGTYPFRRPSVPATLHAISNDPLPAPVRAGSLAPVLRALLAKDPQVRPAARQAGERLASFANSAWPGAAGAAAPPVAPEPATVPQPQPWQPPAAPAAFAAPAAQPPQGRPPQGQFTPNTPPFGLGQPVPPAAAAGWRPAPLAGTAPEPVTMRLEDGGGRRRATIAAAVVAIVLAGGGVTWAVVSGFGGGHGSSGTPLAGASPSASAGAAGASGSAGGASASISPNRPRAAYATDGAPSASASAGHATSTSGSGKGGPGSSSGGGSTAKHTTAPRPAPAPTTAKPAPKPTPKPAPGSSCTYYSGTETTQYGDTGPQVKEVQCILIARGYSVGSGGVDGQFGPDTKSGVEAFQKAKGLEVDGQVGPLTWAALRGN